MNVQQDIKKRKSVIALNKRSIGIFDNNKLTYLLIGLLRNKWWRWAIGHRFAYYLQRVGKNYTNVQLNDLFSKLRDGFIDFQCVALTLNFPLFVFPFGIQYAELGFCLSLSPTWTSPVESFPMYTLIDFLRAEPFLGKSNGSDKCYVYHSLKRQFQPSTEQRRLICDGLSLGILDGLCMIGEVPNETGELLKEFINNATSEMKRILEKE